MAVSVTASTRLVREWNGTEHTVTVMKDGFDWQGQRFKSLSAIAKTITGTSRAKGMWMGGFVPWGYDAIDRKLVINEAEASQVRHLFERFVELGSATKLAREVVRKGITNKRGRPIDKGFLYKLFRNRVYLGEAVHKGTSYPGEHQAIIAQPLWDSRDRAELGIPVTPNDMRVLLFGGNKGAKSTTTPHAQPLRLAA